jgi:MoxR-like ATPase
MLLATQNPIDFEGTYSLPEAQLDRFMMKFSIGYPSGDAEKQMVRAQQGGHPLERLETAANVGQIVTMQEEVKNVHMDDAIMEYVVEIVRRTREHPAVYLGASPRATLALVQAAKAYAYLQEREYVIPDDVKHLATNVLGHRLILNSEARIDGMTPQHLLESIFQQVRVPVRLEK